MKKSKTERTRTSKTHFDFYKFCPLISHSLVFSTLSYQCIIRVFLRHLLMKMAGIEKIREAESCTKDFNTRVSAPGVLENNKVVIIDMDEVYNIGSKVQYLKEFFINALELPGTLTEYRLFGVKEEKEREIDENTTIDDIYKYVLTGSFIMKFQKMPKQG
ncbi:uncharacterized protein LOC106068495 isoform X3 [Biomphalaria glabrata]|uniref:Uncharacterized protein LOC106068495 isoform X3 n=1 Tax=Biomphalaria glabrata TaxID=6526 RepID=A0A9W2YUY5_BIOGL|nr:uncharacterized protein LOC106068495 isoform X3 [Biomphalaria glabrata]